MGNHRIQIQYGPEKTSIKVRMPLISQLGDKIGETCINTILKKYAIFPIS